MVASPVRGSGGVLSHFHWGRSMTSFKIPAFPEAGTSFCCSEVRMEGTLRFSGKILFDGFFKGEIRGDGRLETGAKARTEGRIVAREMIHRGESLGDLIISHRLELDAGAFHQGDVEAKRIRINPASRLEGALRMPGIVPDTPKTPRKNNLLLLSAAGVAIFLLAGGIATTSAGARLFDRIQAGIGILREAAARPRQAWSYLLSRAGRVDKSADALFARSVRQEQEGNLEGAAEALREILQAGGSRTTEARYLLAKILLRTNRPDEARKEIEQLLREVPGHIEGVVLLGDLHAKAGRLDQAALFYGRALRSDPEDVVLRRRLAQGNAMLGKARGKRTPLPLVSEGVLLVEAEKLIAEKRPPQAVKILEAGLQSLPKSARLRYQLGAAYLLMGEKDKAIAAYREVIALSPDWMDAYVRLGALYEAGSRDSEAISLYQRAATLDASGVDMVLRVADLHQRQRRFDQAQEILLKLQKAHPESIKVLVAYGNLLWERKRLDEARKVFEEVLLRNPNSGEALNRLAWLHAMRGDDLDRGIELSKRSLEVRPDTPAYLDTLAELYYKNSEPLKAIPLIQRAITTEPGNRYFRTQLEKFKRASR
ncbi:MAG: tetratricopeptide repeat protein [bacterium]|nr:tetratricopeptide repeat protein [bacterium]